MSASNKKVEEAIEHVRLAEKSLKTSFLKWRADYDEAADEYNKAATCFRNAKSFEQCKECLIKAAECHKQNRHLFYAAKALDQAVSVCKETGELHEVAALAEKAANMYMRHGSGETAAASLDKAAKVLEQQHPDQALSLYQQAADIATIQDSSRQAAEYLGKVARINVKLKQFDAAADAILKEMGIHQQNESFQSLGRLAVALVLVQLGREDVVAAEKAFKEWGNCCETPEIQTLETLLQAYDEDDPEGAKRALNSPFIKHMDVEYSILARDMPLPGGTSAGHKVSAKENVTAPQTTATIQDTPTDAPTRASGDKEEEPEESFGLC
ncbi:hypothetical protein Trydic_g15040 [Trypoxylus dichotomus]